MPHTWRIYPHDPARIQALERAAGISAVAAQLLVCRGITDPDEARSFLNPLFSSLHDPERLPGADEAADCLLRGRGRRRKRSSSMAITTSTACRGPRCWSVA